jgi:hypothetical protein
MAIFVIMDIDGSTSAAATSRDYEAGRNEMAGKNPAI